MKKTKEKEFDAVKMMREIREKLSHRYWKNSELLKKDTSDAIKRYRAGTSRHQPV